jgi:hypothetical protein
VTWCQKRQDSFARGKTARFIASRPSRFLLEAGLMSAEEFSAAINEAAAERPTVRKATRSSSRKMEKPQS